MPHPVRRHIAQQIVDSIKNICDHDINFIDTDGIIYASTDASRTGDFHAAGKQAAQSGETVVVEEDSPLAGTRRGINMPIRYNGEIIAVIGITGDPEETGRYAYLAQRITTLLLKEHDLDRESQNRRTRINYVIRSMIHQENIDQTFMLETLQQSGIRDTDAPYRTLVVQLDSRYNPSNLSMIESEILRVFSLVKPCLYTFNYPGEYVLISEAGSLECRLPCFRDLAQRFRGLLKIGVGEERPLTRQYRSYQAARLCLKSMSSEQDFALFEDLDLEILLGSVSDHARLAFLDRVTASLEEDDRELLSAYFGRSMSLKKTCEALFIHKNTLQYRLKRIADRTGYDPRAFQDAAVLYTALKLESLSGQEKK